MVSFIFLIPTPEILLATKIKSIPDRTKDEKLVKDICDIYALSWYSGKDFREIKNALKNLVAYISLEKPGKRLKDDEELFQKAENATGIEAETIKNTIISLLKRRDDWHFPKPCSFVETTFISTEKDIFE